VRRTALRRVPTIACAAAALTLMLGLPAARVARARPADAPAPAAVPPAASDSVEMIDGVAAVVGNDVVLLSELEQQSFLVASQSGVDPADTAKVRQLRQEVLDRLIDEKVVLEEAQRQGITVPDTEVTRNAQQALDNVRTRFPSEAEYRRELTNEGTTEADLLERYKKDVTRQLLAQRLIGREVGSKIDISDKDVQEYYAKNKDKIPKKPATVRLSQLVLIPTASPALEDAAREKALGVLSRLKSGADFASLARQVSADSTTSRNGGDLGWFSRGEMDKAFENTVFSTDVGKIGGPVRTRFGYHIVKVEEKDGDRVHARHILIRVVPGAADIARTRRQADALRARIVKGESFAAIASAYSMDPASKDKGGDLGEVPLTQLAPQLKSVAGALPVGGISKVLNDDNIFYLFTVTGRQAESAYAFGEITDDLREMVRQEKTQGLYEKWVKGLRAKTFIEVKPRAMG